MPYRRCNHGKCRFPHGHTRKTKVLIESDTLDENDIVRDFSHLKSDMELFVKIHDHSMCVNKSDPIYRRLLEEYGPN